MEVSKDLGDILGSADFELKQISTLKEFGLVASIRTKVFVIEQKCPAIEEFDDKDDIAEHYIGYCDGEPVITCRVLYPETCIAKIGRIATLIEFRGRGFASNLLELLIGQMQKNKEIDEIQMSAQEHAIGLYEKLGFKVYGESYIEDYLPHSMMSLKIS